MLPLPWSGKKRGPGNEVGLFLFVAGTVVGGLVSRQCGHGFILGIIRGFCLLRVVLFSAVRGFSSQCPNFFLSAKTCSSISNLARVHWMRVCGFPLPELCHRHYHRFRLGNLSVHPSSYGCIREAT